MGKQTVFWLGNSLVHSAETVTEIKRDGKEFLESIVAFIETMLYSRYIISTHMPNMERGPRGEKSRSPEMPGRKTESPQDRAKREARFQKIIELKALEANQEGEANRLADTMRDTMRGKSQTREIRPTDPPLQKKGFMEKVKGFFGHPFAKNKTPDRVMSREEDNRLQDDVLTDEQILAEQADVNSRGAKKAKESNMADMASEGLRKAAKSVVEQARKAATGNTGTGLYELGMNAVDAGINVTLGAGKGIASGARKGVELGGRAAHAAASGLDTALEATEKGVHRGLEKTLGAAGKAGELTGRAADAFLNAPAKAMEAGFDLAAKGKKWSKSGPTVSEAARAIVKAGDRALEGTVRGFITGLEKGTDLAAAGVEKTVGGAKAVSRGIAKTPERARGAVRSSGELAAAGMEKGAGLLAKGLEAAAARTRATGRGLGAAARYDVGKAFETKQVNRIREEEVDDENIEVLSSSPSEDALDDGVPEEIARTVKEAAEARQLPKNFEEKFDALMAPRLKEALPARRKEIDLLRKIADGKGGAEGETLRDRSYDGWTNTQIGMLIERLDA